jgi:portal protein
MGFVNTFRDSFAKGAGASNFSNDSKQRILPMSAIAPMGSQSIRDVGTGWFFSALEPVRVVAPGTFRPRQYGFQPGANLTWTPRGDDGSFMPFDILRTFADSWDLLRIIIEAQKDRICTQEFDLRPKAKPNESNKDRKQRAMEDPVLQKLKVWWEKPDGFHKFKVWLRMLLEDMIVIDAATVWLARDKATGKPLENFGSIATAHPIDGATINRLLTDQGMTPPPPSPAYQQVLYGMPVWDFTTDDLIYVMRNERTNKRYGFGPVEQILNIVNFGIRRQSWQTAEYTSGNIPEALLFAPGDITTKQLRELQGYIDSTLAGQLGQRRRLTILPGYGTADSVKSNIVFPKEPLLKDELDEWLAKVACFCIGISAQPFLKMMNRASAEQAQETSEAENLKPWLDTIIDILNDVNARMGFADDYEWVSKQAAELDVLKRAQADNLLTGKVLTINEVREDRGEDPRKEPEADMLGMFSPMNGFIPLGTVPPNSAMGAASGKEQGGATPDTGKPQLVPAKKTPKQQKLIKAAKTAATDDIEGRLAQKVRKFLADMGKRCADAVRSKDLTKAAAPKLPNWDVDDVLAAMIAELHWDDLHKDAASDLEAAALSGAAIGIGQVNITDDNLISSSQILARDWAAGRAAELVGMKWIDGELVENPSAKWAISDTTRDDLRELVSKAFAEETPIDKLADQVESAGAFSTARAKMIAATEVARAQTMGTVKAWQTSGVVQTVRWSPSALGPCDICADNADADPVPLGELFPSGSPWPPEHPWCRCGLVAVQVGEKVSEAAA